MQNYQHISGLVAAPHTPFTESGDVNFEGLVTQIRTLSAQGLTGVFVNGTTGEGLSLTSAERRQILDRWTELAPTDLKIIAHVGHHSVREAADLSCHAAASGAHGIATIGPSFVKPSSAADLVEFCKPIAAAAADLPFYYYHIPSLTGVHVSMPEFLELGSSELPNLAGIKFTHSDLFEYQRCREVEDGRFDILWGVDELLLPALAAGAVGAVGSTYNYAAPLYLRMIEAFNRGDLKAARSYSLGSIRLVETLIRYGVLPAGKAIMALHGVECGPLRPPIAALGPESLTALLDEIEALFGLQKIPFQSDCVLGENLHDADTEKHL